MAEEVIDGETLTPEQIEAESEAGFAEGFGDGPGTQPTPSKVEPSPEPKAEEPKPEVKQEATVVDPDDKTRNLFKEMFQAEINPRLRNLEGTLGGLTGGFKDLLAAVKKNTTANERPSDQQIKEAVQDPDEWKKLNEDWPEFGVAIEKYVAAKLSDRVPAKSEPIDVESAFQSSFEKVTPNLVQRIEEASRTARTYARIDIEIGEGWEDTLKSKDFGEWFSKLPSDKQQQYDTDRASDVIAGLKEFQTYREAAVARQRKKSGLERAVEAPTTRSSGPKPTDEDEAFIAGFEGR